MCNLYTSNTVNSSNRSSNNSNSNKLSTLLFYFSLFYTFSSLTSTRTFSLSICRTLTESSHVTFHLPLYCIYHFPRFRSNINVSMRTHLYWYVRYFVSFLLFPTATNTHTSCILRKNDWTQLVYLLHSKPFSFNFFFCLLSTNAKRLQNCAANSQGNNYDAILTEKFLNAMLNFWLETVKIDLFRAIKTIN